MVPINLEPLEPYTDPWDLGLTERMQKLTGGKRRVAYFYEKPDNSTFRYRIYNMAQVLNDTGGEVSASYFFLDDLHRLSEIVDHADMLVICRTRFDNRIGRLITAFRQRGKRVLFDTDDFVFDIDYVHLILYSLDKDLQNPQVWNDWFAYSSRLGATLKLCDGAITTNAYLAERISSFVRIPVAVVPNFINREQLDLSERIYAAKRAMKLGQQELIHFGYFSGSPSHNRDFAIVAPALQALLEENPKLGVVVAGYIKADAGFKRFGKRVKSFPFHDFVNLQRLVSTVEFNLMPLQHNAFTNSKSELKYFESAIVGTLSIASPSYTYSRAIQHGQNGYLAQGHQWERCIKQALAEIGNYAEMAERAYVDARTKYAWFNQRKTILNALGLESTSSEGEGRS
jgi:glycosyltransferase involved in cell wall biosynthesis